MNYIVSRGEGEGQKLLILLSKKTTKRGWGGQKSPILRRHSLWTAPNKKTGKREGIEPIKRVSTYGHYGNGVFGNIYLSAGKH